MNNAIKILLPAIISFMIGLFLTPIATHYFYKYKMWRRTSRSNNIPIKEVSGFTKIHDEKAEISTPRTGGMIVWISVILTVAVVSIIDYLFISELNYKMYFISRSQTLLPFFALIFASIIGLGDDFLQIFGKGIWSRDPKILRYIKVSIILLLGLILSLWFFIKLGMTGIYVPFYGFIDLGYLFIPFFILVLFSLWSSSVIDGIDGLSGGVLASIFTAYSLISYFNGQPELAALSAVITGAILAFLWFNIPPARFYMGESGMIGLTVTISVISFLTDSVLLLPIIAFPLFITSLSNVIQITYRYIYNGKKFFLFAPLHHHFEAIGWSKAKVTMRYWIISIITAILGVIIHIVS